MPVAEAITRKNTSLFLRWVRIIRLAYLRESHNVTVLLIEHDMKLVMSISDHIVVINQGTPLAHGTPEQIRDNPDVIKAYLGEA